MAKRDTARHAANPGRVAAARALLEVERGAHLEEALARLAPRGPSDRTLAWFLAYGVLRHRAHVDAALRANLRQPLEALDAPVRAALRLGAFEKLYARTRPHAVVHQGVEVARALGQGRASGLVNAVLRRVRTPELHGAAALDHPAWLVHRWRERYGDEAARRWCESNAEPPPLFLVEREPGALPASLREQARPAELRGRPLPGVWRLDGPSGAVPDLEGFTEGCFWVQDAASVAVADLVGPVQGSRVLDACAAPGGKSFRLASRGADVLAVDRSGERLGLLRESAERLGLQVRTRVHDWTTGGLGEAEQFDAVLVDAPCTGLGTVRRHPEIRWRRQEPDIAAAAELQDRILRAASRHVAPGGVLVYAVCSPEPEEGVARVEAFLRSDAGRGFERDTSLSTAPPEAGEDAHQAVRLLRRCA